MDVAGRASARVVEALSQLGAKWGVQLRVAKADLAEGIRRMRFVQQPPTGCRRDGRGES